MIRVLIVEDDPMVAEFNKRYLEQVKGYALQAVAYTADQALEILENAKIDLILLDIYMPGINGLELLSQIRQIGRGVDVIVISAASDIPSIKKALRHGAKDYLIKPFTFERLQAALTTYKQEVNMLEKQEVLSQAVLDKLLHHTKQSMESEDLPKGLTRKTLKTVWDQIQVWKGTDFTTEDLANQVGISRVSLRKYLNFLNEIGVLDMDIHYGAVGRPIYRHRVSSANMELIKRYL